MFGSRDTLRDLFLDWTHEISVFRAYNQLLKYYIPMFYRYCFWLLRVFKVKSSLIIFRKYLHVFPKFYVFFPFHKNVQQMHLKDVEFYNFFKKNSKFKGFFLPNYIFTKTSNLVYKKELLTFSENFFGGLNYAAVNTELSFKEAFNLPKKRFETNLNWTKTNISLKNVISIKHNMINIDNYNLFNLNELFFLYLNFLREVYNFFILLKLYN